MNLFHSGSLKILEIDNVLMLDWDMNKSIGETGGENYPQTVTITKREEVFNIINNRSKYLDNTIKNDFGIRLYWTPNGVRGFITSHLIPANSNIADNAMRVLQTDMAYRYITKTKKVYHIRVSQKNRENDYIACYWTSIGNKTIHPEIIKFLKVHDELCRANRGDVLIPKELETSCVLEQLIKSKNEEPWEEVNCNALLDFIEELSLSGN